MSGPSLTILFAHWLGGYISEVEPYRSSVEKVS